jgi:hypothetical protein
MTGQQLREQENKRMESAAGGATAWCVGPVVFERNRDGLFQRQRFNRRETVCWLRAAIGVSSSR